VLDPDAEGEGLREWFESVGPVPTYGAAFDTRFELPAAITGRASQACMLTGARCLPIPKASS